MGTTLTDHTLIKIEVFVLRSLSAVQLCIYSRAHHTGDTFAQVGRLDVPVTIWSAFRKKWIADNDLVWLLLTGRTAKPVATASDYTGADRKRRWRLDVFHTGTHVIAKVAARPNEHRSFRDCGTLSMTKKEWELWWFMWLEDQKDSIWLLEHNNPGPAVPFK